MFVMRSLLLVIVSALSIVPIVPALALPSPQIPKTNTNGGVVVTVPKVCYLQHLYSLFVLTTPLYQKNLPPRDFNSALVGTPWVLLCLCHTLTFAWSRPQQS